MKTINIALISLSILSLIGCNFFPKKNKSHQKTNIEKMLTSNLEETFNDTITIKHQEDGSKTTLLFNEFTLVLHGFIIYDEENNTKNVQKDSVTIFAELGETIEAKQLSIFSEFLQNIKIEQRFETSVTIMNEGPHCDLIDWIHFYSNWKFLKTNNNNQFICAKYSSKEKEKFPQIPIEELKLKVLEQCGEDWAKIIQYIKNPNEYPSGVNISRYFLRISGDRKDSGEKISKLIIIDVPMGC